MDFNSKPEKRDFRGRLINVVIPCEFCKTDFRATLKSARFCSRTCYESWRAWYKAQPKDYGTTICEVCGGVVVQNKYKCLKTCCPAHAKVLKDAARILVTEARKLGYKADHTLKCKHCGADFQIPPCSHRRKTCSESCEKALARARNRGGRVMIKCDGCNTEFSVTVSRQKTGTRFCTIECSQKWFHVQCTEVWVGEKSHIWTGGGNNSYGPTWRRTRRAVVLRDNDTCQSCGITGGETGQRSHVHHITPFCCYGVANYVVANRLDNLIALCNSCHSFEEQKNFILVRKCVSMGLPLSTLVIGRDVIETRPRIGTEEAAVIKAARIAIRQKEAKKVRVLKYFRDEAHRECSQCREIKPNAECCQRMRDGKVSVDPLCKRCASRLMHFRTHGSMDKYKPVLYID